MLVAGERRIDRIGVLTFSYDCNERATDESFRLSTVLYRFFFLQPKSGATFLKFNSVETVSYCNIISSGFTIYNKGLPM